jgi:hypothetical protein
MLNIFNGSGGNRHKTPLLIAVIYRFLWHIHFLDKRMFDQLEKCSTAKEDKLSG